MRTGIKTLYRKVTGTEHPGLPNPGGLEPWPSETSKCRARLAPFCAGYGLDIGPGGDPIVPAAIRVDLHEPYSHVGVLPVQLGGDAASLHWFKDGVLDYVYSSHVLEDFIDTESVLREWLRVLKPGGRLIIYCPDEQAYRGFCKEQGYPRNQCHVHETFSLAYVKNALTRIGHLKVLHELPLVDGYSWDLVV